MYLHFVNIHIYVYISIYDIILGGITKKKKKAIQSSKTLSIDGNGVTKSVQVTHRKTEKENREIKSRE